MPTLDWLGALGSVVVIDLLLSADNAVVIGLAATGLPPGLRRRAIVLGILAATVLRVALALVTFELLTIVGLTLAGGLLLLWVCWRMWREIRAGNGQTAATPDAGDDASGNPPGIRPRTFGRALAAIIVADVSMALDNVLAVAGAASKHFEVLIFGLILSVALMGVAANYVARLLERYHVLSYFGLAVVLFVALDMIYRGIHNVAEEVARLAFLVA